MGQHHSFDDWPIDAKSDISRNHIMFGEIGAYTATVPSNSNATLRVSAKGIEVTSKTNVEVVSEGPQKVVKLPADTHSFEIVQ
jgi:hypothetical protein